MSEIILQQTRVDQGLPYYQRFVSRFPTVHDLAGADAQVVMKTWEGLGYYSRARNLHATAQHIAHNLNGQFPETYEGLLQLKGVGPYTAAAIASIAFGVAEPVLDGNVFRFISRHFGVEKEIADTKNRKYFIDILNELIPENQPADFNQAIMEFGATVCKPAPQCSVCAFRDSCYAYKYEAQGRLPVKNKKIKTKEVFLDYFVMKHDDQVLMRKRTESIWNELFEFHSSTDTKKEVAFKTLRDQYEDIELVVTFDTVKHLLTHRKLWVSFHHVTVDTKTTFLRLAKDLGLKPYSWQEVLTLPVPKVIVNHLEQIEI